NDSLFKQWKKFTTAVSDTFRGEFNKSYKFFSVAVDRAGNYEDPPFDPYVSPDAATSVQAALPVSLLSFDARKTTDGKQSELLWVTTFEQQVSRFEIERSADGINYGKIGVVSPLNIATGSNYKWQDLAPLNGLNYYRLRMIDVDGTFKLSPVKTVQFGTRQDLLVFPTLTSSLIFVQSPTKVTAQLVNLLGEVLQQQVVNGTSSFNLSSLPSGMYFIRIKEQKKTYKIIKK
ncbi:MAG: T9SS type A sorting domain-containing protein, partial [Gloeobacteraceae cyanobacterium ES-bin-316]|nr:T9SS type A sorting domain-containing protein [Ferruginibacter sp.]